MSASSRRSHPITKEVIEQAKDVWPKILRTTDQALAFNDKYEDDNALTKYMGELSGDLSQLIAHIATRIELEDRLINALNGIKP